MATVGNGGETHHRVRVARADLSRLAPVAGRGVGVLVIDEAQHMTVTGGEKRLPAQLEQIKSVADSTGTLFVRVGTYGLLESLDLNGQLARRRAPCADLAQWPVVLTYRLHVYADLIEEPELIDDSPCLEGSIPDNSGEPDRRHLEPASRRVQAEKFAGVGSANDGAEGRKIPFADDLVIVARTSGKPTSCTS